MLYVVFVSQSLYSPTDFSFSWNRLGVNFSGICQKHYQSSSVSMSVIVCTYVSYQSINVLSCGFYTLSFCSPLRFSPKNLRNLSGFIKLSLSIPSRSKSINDRTATISASRHTTLFIIWATPSKTLSLSFCFLNIINYSKERWHNIILSVKRD